MLTFLIQPLLKGVVMAEKANQHFVPRLLLKRFSNSEGKINIFDTSSGEIISDVPYKPQCAKNIFMVLT